MLFRENCCTFGKQSKLNPFKLGMKRIRHSTFTFMKQLCSFSLWWNIFIKEIPTKLIFEIFSWIKRYHNNGAFQQNFSISVWRDLCQLSVWSICGYCYYQRAVWELSSVRYNIPAHCLALLLILIPANQKLWFHAFLCLSTNFRWLTKDLYYHTPDRHMLFKLKKKTVLENKSFFEWSWYSWNLWFEKEGYWGGGCVRTLSHFGKFQNGSSTKNVKPLTWKKLAIICYVISFLGCHQV